MKMDGCGLLVEKVRGMSAKEPSDGKPTERNGSASKDRND
jgi:hypothetical protein